MARIVVWIFRLLPLEIILLVAAYAGFKILSNRKNSTIAKEALIKVVMWFNIVLGAIFLLIALYALADGNNWVIEITLAFAIICAIFLAIALICKHNFLKRRPNYPWKRLNSLSSFSKVFKTNKGQD